jgi:hypothetical protein
VQKAMDITIHLRLESHLKLDISVAPGHLNSQRLIGLVRTFGQVKVALKRVLLKAEEVNTDERQGGRRHFRANTQSDNNR